MFPQILKFEIVYEDAVIIVVNKPAEFLSVPGKNISDSVYTRVKAMYPEAQGPLIVHRLDMSTSGLMVLAKTKSAHQFIQQQFINKTVQKRYTALLNGIPKPIFGLLINFSPQYFNKIFLIMIFPEFFENLRLSGSPHPNSIKSLSKKGERDSTEYCMQALSTLTKISPDK